MNRTLPVTLTLLLACVSVFLYELTLNEGDEFRRFLIRYALIPRLLMGDPVDVTGIDLLPAPLTLLTSLFVHADTAHLVVNMIVLISFGAIVERALGSWKMVLIYLTSGVSGGMVFSVIVPNSITPVIGASGALSGIFATAFLLDPRGKIFLIFIPMPFWLGMVVFVIAHAIFIASGWGAGIAWLAHVGGLLGGFVMSAMLAPRLLASR
ncbi:MAG: rhomboid family intramembrane serine protease [Rhodospirillaceae bacterium]|nr:rhomboid family intramembrane serine protease [Rhodospirillaceae bacterium]